MTLCARCEREHGITLYGRHHPPQKADVLPTHTWGETEGRSKERVVSRLGPLEPLCSQHLELTAWERTGKNENYPPPVWSRTPSESQRKTSDALLARIHAGDDLSTKKLSGHVSDLLRQPGDESDEV